MTSGASSRDDRALALMDDAATIAALVRRTPAARLAEEAWRGWSWLDLVGHVADSAALELGRIRRMLAEDDPALPTVPGGTLVAARRGRATDARELARMILADHAEIVRLLDEPGAPARTARLGPHAAITAAALADRHARHVHAHVARLAAAFPPTA